MDNRWSKWINLVYSFEKRSKQYGSSLSEHQIGYMNYCLKGLELIPPEMRLTDSDQAIYHWLKGRVLDFLPFYNNEAEYHLERAVQLDQQFVDPYKSLSKCFTKKKDFVKAQGHIQHYIALMGPDKGSLCQMSLIGTKLAPDDINPTQIIEQSIRHAKEAVRLDPEDGFSRYTLGIAYFALFSQTGEWDYDLLLLSTAEFEKAMHDVDLEIYPDLLYDWARVDAHLENYERALTGFSKCKWADPPLEATNNMNVMIQLLDRINDLLKGKGKVEQSE